MSSASTSIEEYEKSTNELVNKLKSYASPHLNSNREQYLSTSSRDDAAFQGQGFVFASPPPSMSVDDWMMDIDSSSTDNNANDDATTTTPSSASRNERIYNNRSTTTTPNRSSFDGMSETARRVVVPNSSTTVRFAPSPVKTPPPVPVVTRTSEYEDPMNVNLLKTPTPRKTKAPIFTPGIAAAFHTTTTDSTTTVVPPEYPQTPGFVRNARSSNNHHVYKQYYESIRTLLQSRRDDDESRTADLEFLFHLQITCWNNTNNNIRAADEEGNVWNLLHHLRQLSSTHLVWEDDASSYNQYKLSISSFIKTTIASASNATPASILRQLTQNGPLAYQRWCCILQSCQDWYKHKLTRSSSSIQALSDSIVRKCNHQSVTHNNNNNNNNVLRQGLHSIVDEGMVLQHVLHCILIGDMDAVKYVLQHTNLEYRAHIYSSYNTLYDIVTNDDDGTTKSVGTKYYSLWRKGMYDKSQACCTEFKKQERSSSPDATVTALDATIAGILSSNVMVALDCICDHSFEVGLNIFVRAMIDYQTDVVVQEYNAFHQSKRPCYPTTSSTSIPNTTSTALLSSSLATLNEKTIQQSLTNSPFPSMHPTNSIPRRVIAAVITGKSALHQFMLDDNTITDNIEDLRFVTHFAIYMDSLDTSSDDFCTWKNSLLVQYIQHLASSSSDGDGGDELWYMVVLYASLLPKSMSMETLPMIFATTIHGLQQRQIIVSQLLEYMAAEVSSVVLEQTVNCILVPRLDGNDDDERKMNAVLWLCYEPTVHGTLALQAANTILHQFLLVSNVHSAMYFLDSVFPVDTILPVVEEQQESNSGSSIHMYHTNEQLLTCIQAYEQWSKQICSTSPIADHRSQQQTRGDMVYTIVTASTSILAEYNDFLEYVDFDEILFGTTTTTRMTNDDGILTTNQQQYEQHIHVLQKYLKEIVDQYCTICIETADWLSECYTSMIDDTESSHTIVSSLLSNQEEEEEELYKPQYWIDIVRTVILPKLVNDSTTNTAGVLYTWLNDYIINSNELYDIYTSQY